MNITKHSLLFLGKKFAGSGLCGVSILRAGETMEKALMKVTKEIRLGKFLIQVMIGPQESMDHRLWTIVYGVQTLDISDVEVE